MAATRRQTHDVHPLAHYLKDGNVAFFGFEGDVPPDFVAEKKGRTRFFLRRGRRARLGGHNFSTYESIAELREERSDVYFLDREATKVLFADFPGSAKYVLVRLVPRVAWVLALPGLLRRLRHGLVSWHGVITFSAGGRPQKWLVLRHELVESLNPRLSLSKEVGIQGFLDHLKEKGARYVVARFYEKLPELNRPGGDIDILVSDEHDGIVRSFLQANPGPIGVDVWTVSRANNNGITYYPPPLARRIIDSAVVGPAGARIPAPREAFLALAYHALYHKGPFAGVPSSTPGVRTNQHPENDYTGTLARLAANLGIDINISMESLDEYLEEQGWRPKTDTLAKIAPRNIWVWRRYFSTSNAAESGLGVLILKNKAVALGLGEKIAEAIAEFGDFKVLRSKTFSPDDVPRIAEQLRGGIWHDGHGSQEDYLPAHAMIVFDARLARASKSGVVAGDPDKRIRALKKYLRKKFDTEKVSLIHSTDNTHESWEYIAVAFTDETEEIRIQVENESARINISLSEKLSAIISALPRTIGYRFAIAKQRLAGRLVRYLMRV